MSVSRVYANNFGIIGPLIVQYYLQILRTIHYVVVRHDVTVGTNDHTRATALLQRCFATLATSLAGIAE